MGMTFGMAANRMFIIFRVGSDEPKPLFGDNEGDKESQHDGGLGIEVGCIGILGARGWREAAA